MSAISEELDAKLKTLDAKAASSLEKLVRDALELGMSVGAVYQAKSRVLRRLRQELDGLLE